MRQHPRTGTDADDRRALLRLAPDPRADGRIRRVVQRRYDHVVRTLGMPRVEVGRRLARLEGQRGHQLQPARLGRDRLDLGHAGRPQHAVRDDVVGGLGPRVQADHRDDRHAAFRRSQRGDQLGLLLGLEHGSHPRAARGGRWQDSDHPGAGEREQEATQDEQRA